MKFQLCAAVMLAGFLCTGPAAAEDTALEGRAERIVVSTSDLDLTTRRGADEALRRIESAAARLCARERSTLFDRRAERACLDAVVNDAVARLQAPLVTATHENSRQSARPTRSWRDRLHG